MIENYSKDNNYVDFKISTIEGLQNSDYVNNMNEMNSNFVSIDQRVDDLNDKYNANKDVLNRYENNLVTGNKKQSLEDARNEDADTYLVEQNYLYILGTLTFAIVFVGAIVIIRN